VPYVSIQNKQTNKQNQGMAVGEYHDVFGGYPNGPAQTGLGNGLIHTFSQPVPILLILYFVSVIVSTGMFAIWKLLVAEQVKELRLDESQRSDSQLATGARRRSMSRAAEPRCEFQNGEVKMVGYKDTIHGTICYRMLMSISGVLAIWYFVLIFDTYWDCEIAGPDNLCFFGSRPIFGSAFIDSEIFFCWWVFALFWNIFLVFKGKYISNYFREKCNFDEAEWVCCIRKHKRVVMVDSNQLIKFARRMSQKLGYGSAYFMSTVPVTTTVSNSNSIRLIEFMCTVSLSIQVLFLLFYYLFSIRMCFVLSSNTCLIRPH
jgi:hypothetical protein